MNFFYEERELDNAIHHLRSRRVLVLADWYFIPKPEFSTKSEAWVDDDGGKYRLSENAIFNMWSAIRKEKKEHHEHALMWLAGLTGVIGASIGLFQVLLSSN